ncbi:MAG: type VI secretion system protein TssA [Pseudomonadota bacterium]
MLPDLAELMAPVDAAQPCGPDLEYDPAFIELLEAARGKPEQQVGGAIIAAEEPDFSSVARDAAELLGRSKDLRLAAILAEASLRLEGLPALAVTLSFVQELLDAHWDDVHPLLDADDDDDPTMRINAMAPFTLSEREGDGPVLRALRLAPLTESRAFGRITLRDLAIVRGEAPAPEGFDLDRATVMAAFADTDAAHLETTVASVAEARSATKAIDALLTERTGPSAPDLTGLDRALYRISQLLDEYVDLPAEDADSDDGEESDEDDGADMDLLDGGAAPAARRASGAAPGAIASGADVVRTLDRLCEYYERNEPSSPVPLLLRRARRLVDADFTTIIRDMASDGYDQVVRIGGLEEEE